MSAEILPWDNRRIDDKEGHRLLKIKVLDLTLPPHNLIRSQIASKVNRSVSKIYRIQRELVRDGKLQTNFSGRIIKAKPDRFTARYEDLTKTQFMQISSIKKWKNSLERSSVKNIPYIIVNFWKVCKTLDVHPDAFLINDINEVSPLIDEFIKLFREGRTFYLKKKRTEDPIKQSKSNPQHYIESIRSFIKRNGGEIPDGYLVIKRSPTDLYSTIKLTDNERIKAIKFMEKFGKDIYNLFVIHNEIGVRSDTLFTMKPRFEKITRVLDGSDDTDKQKIPVKCSWYKALIFEKKQQRPYEKFIFTPRAKAVVEKLKEDKPIHNYQSIKKGKDEYNEKLRQVFSYLGKISSDPTEYTNYDQGSMRWYIVKRPSTVLRHSCIHWLMRITGNNATSVSSLFWEQEETLKIYSKQSFDDILQTNDCAFCRPSLDLDKSFRRFCGLKHAIIYFNNGGKSKSELLVNVKS